MKIRVIILFLFFPLFFNAQHLEVGISVGVSNYLGDLAPSNLWTSVGQSNLAKGAFARVNINDFFAIRTGFSHGVISANDAFSVENNFRKKRNLSFRSDIYEAALLGEINILGFQPRDGKKFFSPYIFGGIAIFKFNPQAQYENNWYDLQPLGTEGQGLQGYPEKYELTQYSIPVGMGIKVAMNKNFSFAIEVGFRKTYTDYLDDVSSFYPDLEKLTAANGEIASTLSWRTLEISSEAIPPQSGSGRGDPEDLDWYIFSKFSISYNFIKKENAFKKGKRRKKKGKLRCPDF